MVEYTKCIKHLLNELEADDLIELLKLRENSKDYDYDTNSEEWFIGNHFGFGTYIRNILREVQSDEEIGGNWDDYYIEILNATLDYFMDQINEVSGV